MNLTVNPKINVDLIQFKGKSGLPESNVIGNTTVTELPKGLNAYQFGIIPQKLAFKGNSREAEITIDQLRQLKTSDVGSIIKDLPVKSLVNILNSIKKPEGQESYTRQDRSIVQDIEHVMQMKAIPEDLPLIKPLLQNEYMDRRLTALNCLDKICFEVNCRINNNKENPKEISELKEVKNDIFQSIKGCLNEKSSPVSNIALFIVKDRGEKGNPEHVKLAVPFLRAENINNIEDAHAADNALLALAVIGTPDSMEKAAPEGSSLVTRFLEDKNVTEKSLIGNTIGNALYALASVGKPDDTKYVQKFLNFETDPSTICKAIDVVKRIGTPDHIKLLEPIVNKTGVRIEDIIAEYAQEAVEILKNKV